MDIRTKEQFLKEYDEHITKIIMGGAHNCSENCRNWLVFLGNTKIAWVRDVLKFITKYISLDKFNEYYKEIFSIQTTTIRPDKEEILRIVISATEEKYDFLKDFVFLCYGITSFGVEITELFNTSYDGFLSRFEDISNGLRETFVTCLDLPDADPNVDRGEQREIPASDRIVKINHNAPEYQEIIEKLEELEASIRKSNSIENEDKDRLQAELKAGEGILKGKTARIEVIKTLLVKGLKYIIEHVVDVAIVVTAEYLLKLIFQYFGLTG